MTFLHLNLHSDRSVAIGMIKPAALAARMKEMGVGAACITDYANMSAVPALRKACLDNGIKPIYGMEVNLTHDKELKDKEYKRLVLLAKNRTGFNNLVRLASIGSMYFYYVSRIDFSDLQKYGEGLIAITADSFGVGFDTYFKKQEMGLVKLWVQYREVFGDDFYFEIQPVPTDPQRAYNEAVVKLAMHNPNMHVVLTGHPHYLDAADRDLHEAVMHSKQYGNPGWQYPFSGACHVRTKEEMVQEMSELHGYDVSTTPGFKDAFDSPQAILEKVESFDIRDGVKIPTV